MQLACGERDGVSPGLRVVRFRVGQLQGQSFTVKLKRAWLLPLQVWLVLVIIHLTVTTAVPLVMGTTMISPNVAGGVS